MRAGVCVAYIHTRVCICVSERVKGQGVKNASDELAEAQANTARGAVESTIIKARRARAPREKERGSARFRCWGFAMIMQVMCVCDRKVIELRHTRLRV